MKTERIQCDLAVIGGGLSGVCCAIAAARAGVKVVLVGDRPVLGGNASSEVRLWILGATSHLGNNNRWAREGGVIDEILTENLYRNPEGNPLLVDVLLLEKVVKEPNLRLLLNTAAYQVTKKDSDTIAGVRAFCAQNSTFYEIEAPYFCDASGDGVVAFLAGAAFRIGAEAREEFDEGFAPETATSELLGHTIYFYSKDVGRPVQYVPPSFALDDIRKIPRFRQFNASDIGCRLWWLEWGGKLDTVHDSEAIKWELWRVVYGAWNHIKNSGEFPEAENLTLEWVGTIPGKRESRRFEGDYILSQKDLVEQREHEDAVSFGGWAIDLHPVEGLYDPGAGCVQWHTKGVYQIPYRCLYSRNISNLFLAGRIISASHVAFGSTRVMATCAHSGQAVGVAAALCLESKLMPREIQGERLQELQRRLLRSGQYIPGQQLHDPADLVSAARLSATSEYSLSELSAGGGTCVLDFAGAMMIPVPAGLAPSVTFTLDVEQDTELVVSLAVSSRRENHTPDRTLASRRLSLQKGAAREVTLDFGVQIDEACYAFYALEQNPSVAVHLSEQRVTGVLSVWQKYNRAVAKSARQEPPAGIGVDAFDFWLPERRPGGKNMALRIEPPIRLFGAENVSNGIGRPTNQPNAWVAAMEDEEPVLSVEWTEARTLSRIEFVFDTDFDHPMESVLMGHPERVMPFCVADFEIMDDEGRVLHVCRGNHESRRVVDFEAPVTTRRLAIQFQKPSFDIPAAVLELRCFPE